MKPPMTQTQTDNTQVTEFRAWVAAQLAGDETFGEPRVDDRPDGSTLSTRWPIGESLFLEVTVRPHIPQVRIGVVTDDRWKSEELEQSVEDSGDTMEEFLELGFDEAGLEWEEPPVEHYRDQGKWFSFMTPLEIASVSQLGDSSVRDKVMRMIRGYCMSYGRL
jgi:hypothetical protein